MLRRNPKHFLLLVMPSFLRPLLIGACLAAIVPPVAAQVPFSFTPVVLDVPDVAYGKLAHADVDNDGDMDVVAIGITNSRVPFNTAAYVGLGGDIVPISLFNQDPKREFDVINLPGVGLWSGEPQWLDYNNDGILDVLVTGTTHTAAPYESRPFEGNTLLFRGKDDGTYERVNVFFPGVYGSSVAIGDADNDGDEDILLSGFFAPGRPFTRLYRNDGGTYRRGSPRFEALAFGESKWIDIDGDGDLDLLHSGVSGSNTVHTLIYRNNGEGRFTREDDVLPNLVFGSTDWGDYDSDGDLDVAISGARLDPIELLVPYSAVLRNDGGSFVPETKAQLFPVMYGSMGWADYDNDGDLDLMVTGQTNTTFGRKARVFRQENGWFPPRVWLPAVATGSAAWVDFDGNGVVDLLLSGSNRSLQPMSRLYRNEITAGNSIPLPPSALNATVSGPAVTLSWDPGSDEQTPVEGLMYNLRVGTSAGGDDVMSAYADASTGQRRLTGPGNVWQARERTLQLPNGNYFWSVQTVDQAFAGSEFAAEGTFQITSSPGDATATEDQVTYEYELFPSYPNPFSNGTTIGYSLREYGRVNLDVYNVLGQRVRRLVSEDQPAGKHQIEWQGLNDHGGRLAAGVYVVRFVAGGKEQTQQMVLVR